MVLSLLVDLATSKGLREALPFFTSIVEQEPEFTNKDVLTLAREFGFSFTDSAARNIINQLRVNAGIASRFRATGPGSLPDPSTLIRSAAPLTKNYSFLVSVRGYNPLTAEQETRHFQIVSDDLMSLDELRLTALNLPREGGGSAVLQNEVVDVISGTAGRYAPI